MLTFARHGHAPRLIKLIDKVKAAKSRLIDKVKAAKSLAHALDFEALVDSTLCVYQKGKTQV